MIIKRLDIDKDKMLVLETENKKEVKLLLSIWDRETELTYYPIGEAVILREKQDNPVNFLDSFAHVFLTSLRDTE